MRGVLVTGGALGIGRAVSQQLCRSGERVVVCDLREVEDSDTQAKSINSLSYVQGDVRDLATIDRCLHLLPQGMNGLVLCAAAGPLSHDSVQIVQTNYSATVRTVLECSSRLVEWGAVVFISSTAAYRQHWHDDWYELLEEPFGGAPAERLWARVAQMTAADAYALSKWGVLEATKRLAGALAGRRIRVNCVVPGPTLTEMSRPLWQNDVEAWERLVAESPFRRANDPDEVASVIRFLLGPDARMVHGSFIHIDGGWYSCHAQRKR